uniref:Sugar-dependent 1 tag lipase n=1 Tax=Lobosphaera incisa TaxID=312850 RepID=A0A1X9QDR6_9CHLO|nr:sugar-dependent 1 tag lipase [Lobosphaera incisa]
MKPLTYQTGRPPVCRTSSGLPGATALLDLTLVRLVATLSVPFRKLLAFNLFIGRAPLQILRYALYWIGWLSAPPRTPLLRHLGTDFLQTRRWHFGLGTVLLAAAVSAARRKWLETTSTDAQLRKRLRQATATATNYQDWSIAATALDQLQGNDSLSRWKRETRLYDRKLLQERLSHLQEVRARGDVGDMMFAVRADLLRNLGNMTNSELHEHFPLVPEPIREYIAEVRLNLQIITNYEGPDISAAEKLQFLQETRHAFGRTALVLSGGGALGAFHLGVVKTLFEQKLLPRVLAGSSVGSIVASIIATNDDDQLQKLFDHMREFDLSFFSNATAAQFFNHFLVNGTLQDMEVLQNRLRRLLGDETLLQAYTRTGRVLNVAVTAADTNEPPRILNYLTAPNVVIWSAVACSSAFPLLYTPGKLFAKDTKKNVLVPFTAEAMRTSERRWRDGSLEEDLPMRTLSEMFNVNYFLVSQTNPHIVPVLNLKKRFNRKLGNLLEAEWKHRCKQLVEILPTGMGKFLKVFSQVWEGDVTMVLPSTFWQLRKAITNPSKDDLVAACRQGEQVTWSKLSAIQANCGIETTLDECLIKLSETMFAQKRQRSVGSTASSPMKVMGGDQFPGPGMALGTSAPGTSAFVAAGGSEEPLAYSASSRARNSLRGRNGMGGRIPSWLHLPSLGMPTVPSDESLDSYSLAVRAGSTDDLPGLRATDSPTKASSGSKSDLISELISSYSSRPLPEVPEVEASLEGLPAPEEFPEWSGSAAFDCCDRSVNIWETLLPLASSSMGGQALDVIAP